MKLSSVVAAVAIAAFSTVFCSCDDGGGKYNPNAKIYINGVDALNKVATTQQRLTVEQICKGDSVCLMDSFGSGDLFAYTGETDGHRIDTVNMRLVFPAYNIVGVDGHYDIAKNEFFEEARHFFLLDGHSKGGSGPYDTLAYIPTQSRMAAKEVLLELFKDIDANREAIYKVFTEAFTFIPCTGAEYKAMIERGEQ